MKSFFDCEAGSIQRCLIIGLLLLADPVILAAKPQSWIDVRSPNFRVITNGNEKQARRVAYQFETIRAVFNKFFDIKDSVEEQPLVVIAAKDEDTLKDLLPEFWSKRGTAHPAGIFLSGMGENYVGLRLDVSTDETGYESLYHEYVHFLTRRMMPHLPLWINEGLAECYGNTIIQGKQVYVGAPSRSAIIVLRQNALLPLNTLFSVDKSSPYYHEANKTSIFYAQSWALIHYLITRDWRERTNRIPQFVDLLRRNVAQGEAARKSIGDPAALESALGRYIRDYTFTAAVVKAPSLDEGHLRIEKMSDAEWQIVRKDFIAHDINHVEPPTVSSDKSDTRVLTSGTFARRQMGALDILSDTQGIDLGPYLQRILKDVKTNWYQLIPESAAMKKGKLAIEFSIAKDGQVMGMKLVVSSGDVMLDRPAWGSITKLDSLSTSAERIPRPVPCSSFPLLLQPRQKRSAVTSLLGAEELLLVLDTIPARGTHG